LPLYEYQCKKCGKRFERIQKFSGRPVKKCAECGGAVERLLSAATVQFKGSGWYVTDYARKPAAAGAAAEGSDGKQPEGKQVEGKQPESKQPEAPAKGEEKTGVKDEQRAGKKSSERKSRS